MPRILFGLVEVVMLILFVLSARFAYRTGGRQRLIELLSAVPFGLLLEQGDIKIFGSYAYNQGFFIKLGSVPVAIALAWAMIITSSMFMSDRLGIPPRLAPFADAVFAIMLALVPFIALQQFLFGGPTGGFPPFLVTLALFAVLTGWAIRRGEGRLPKPWMMPLFPRLLIHGYFLSAGIVLGI